MKMGRPPIGKVAMTTAERVRRYRLKHGTDKPVTKPVTKAAPDHTALAQAKQELAQARAEITALKDQLARERKRHEAAEAKVDNAASPTTASVEQLQARILDLEQRLEEARKEAVKARAFISAAEDFLDRKARIVPHSMYQTLLHSSHPDRVTDPKMKARYQKVFVFLKEHERTLAKRKPPPPPPPMPRTLAEWDAAKWHAREERKAKRAAAKAAKAPRKPLPKA
jgi:hypothetical protein